MGYSVYILEMPARPSTFLGMAVATENQLL